jgi:hypothetical protein
MFRPCIVNLRGILRVKKFACEHRKETHRISCRLCLPKDSLVVAAVLCIATSQHFGSVSEPRSAPKAASLLWIDAQEG